MAQTQSHSQRPLLAKLQFWPLSHPTHLEKDPQQIDLSLISTSNRRNSRSKQKRLSQQQTTPRTSKQLLQFVQSWDTSESTPDSNQDIVPSCAAKHVFTAISLCSSKSSPLRLHLKKKQSQDHKFAALTIYLNLLSLTNPGQVLKKSDCMRFIFWHIFHFRKHSNSPNHLLDTCGFVGCAGACMPKPSRDAKMSFQLDRLFQKSTQIVQQRQESEKKHEPPINRQNDSPLQNLPDDIIFNIVSRLKSSDLTTLSRTSRWFAEFLKSFVPNLSLRLYPHQIDGVNRMMQMERRSKPSAPLPLIEKIDADTLDHNVAVDLTDGSMWVLNKMPKVSLPRGGLFCDEPGLGKTITAISLILKTLSKIPDPPDDQQVFEDGYFADHPVRYYHEEGGGRFRACGDVLVPYSREVKIFPEGKDLFMKRSPREVRQPDFFQVGKGHGVLPTFRANDFSSKIFLSHASLIIVPPVLTDQWMYQLETHIEFGKLEILYINKKSDIPSSAIEIANFYDVVLTSFDVIRQLYASMRDEAPPLLRIQFLRIIVDEGHRLSSRGSTSEFISVCDRLRAERRWVMTGTPTPYTVHSDVDYMQALLRFVRDEGYGHDKSAWFFGIRDPYTNFRTESLERLTNVLNYVMIRADKSVLPYKCLIENITLDFNKEAASSYNDLVRLTRRNLILADWYSEKHEESLLYWRNHQAAREVVDNLRFACCFGGTVNVLFDYVNVVEVLDILYNDRFRISNIKDEDKFLDPQVEMTTSRVDAAVDDLTIEQDEELNRRVRKLKRLQRKNTPHLRLSTKKDGTGEFYIYTGRLQEIGTAFFSRNCYCDNCEKHCTFPFITPCAHLLCDECLINNKKQCGVITCRERYKLDKHGVPENLIELQPAALSSEWRKDWDQIFGEKVKFVLKSIQDLPKIEVWKNNETEPEYTRQKVIIYSEHVTILRYITYALRCNKELCNTYIETIKNEMEMMHDYFEGTAAEFAKENVKKFIRDPTISILLLDSKQGALGLDLSMVNYIYLMEPQWDSAMELQIMSRAHRIGCKGDVYVKRMTMKGSVEEALVKLRQQNATRTAEIEQSGVETEKKLEDLMRTRGLLKSLQLVEGEELETKETMGLKRGAESEAASNDECRVKRVRFA